MRNNHNNKPGDVIHLTHREMKALRTYPYIPPISMDNNGDDPTPKEGSRTVALLLVLGSLLGMIMIISTICNK